MCFLFGSRDRQVNGFIDRGPRVHYVRSRAVLTEPRESAGSGLKSPLTIIRRVTSCELIEPFLLRPLLGTYQERLALDVHGATPPGTGESSVLRQRLRELATARPRFGHPRLHILLTREGWQVRHKRISLHRGIGPNWHWRWAASTKISANKLR
jgi:hypothetical protein